LAREPFAAALDRYYAGEFTVAAEQFEALAANDPVAGKYARHCAELAATAITDWDGVWRLTSK
jgi:hypothetical protein